MRTPKQYNDTAIFAHMCCNSGYTMIRDYIADHPNTKIENYSYLVVKDKQIDKQYNFNLESLREYSYIIESNGNILKTSNKDTKRID